MAYYRITAKLQGPLATPLISGTFWGHLAWAVRYIDGEDALSQWLAEQQSQPWLVSSQMPMGMIPKPLFAHSSQPDRFLSLNKIEQIKRVRNMRFIPEKVFTKIRSKMSESALIESLVEHAVTGDAYDAGLASIRIAHNRIDRRTGRTPDEGGLFFDDAVVAAQGTHLQMFVECPKAKRDQLQTLLDFIGTNGFGANASVGCGSINFEIQEETGLFKSSGTRAMTLSHGTVSNNMYELRYRLHVHFGKTGGHYAIGAYSPFKYPILMMMPGTTFTPQNNGPYGELLDHVHHDPHLEDLRHYAFHLPVYFTEVVP